MIISIVATVYAWKVNRMYKDFIDGVNDKVKDYSSKKDINTGYMDQMLAKLSKPNKNASAVIYSQINVFKFISVFGKVSSFKKIGEKNEKITF